MNSFREVSVTLISNGKVPKGGTIKAVSFLFHFINYAVFISFMFLSIDYNKALRFQFIKARNKAGCNRGAPSIEIFEFKFYWNVLTLDHYQSSISRRGISLQN